MAKSSANKPTEQREDQSASYDPQRKPFGADENGIVTHIVPVLPRILLDYKNLPITADTPPMCTWSLDSTEGRAKLHQILNIGGPALWDLCENGPYRIVVANLAAHFTSWEPEDRPGEVIEGPMLHLVGPEGVYHSSSDGIFSSLQQLAHLEGPPPWDPPVILSAERAPTRNRRMRLALSLIGRG